MNRNWFTVCLQTRKSLLFFGVQCPLAPIIVQNTTMQRIDDCKIQHLNKTKIFYILRKLSDSIVLVRKNDEKCV
jgi:hypothetical protein